MSGGSSLRSNPVISSVLERRHCCGGQVIPEGARPKNPAVTITPTERIRSADSPLLRTPIHVSERTFHAS